MLKLANIVTWPLSSSSKHGNKVSHTLLFALAFQGLAAFRKFITNIIKNTILNILYSCCCSFTIPASYGLFEMCKKGSEQSWGDLSMYHETEWYYCFFLSILLAVRRELGWSGVISFASSSSKQPDWTRLCRPTASQNLSHLHGACSAHDQVGHPPSISDWGESAGQEKPAGALRQLHPHPDLPASDLHNCPAE